MQLLSHIEGLLYVGVSINKITDGMYLKDYFGDMLIGRDTCIMRKDAINLQHNLQRITIEKDDNDK